jgi:hypothetical protein
MAPRGAERIEMVSPSELGAFSMVGAAWHWVPGGVLLMFCGQFGRLASKERHQPEPDALFADQVVMVAGGHLQQAEPGALGADGGVHLRSGAKVAAEHGEATRWDGGDGPNRGSPFRNSGPWPRGGHRQRVKARSEGLVPRAARRVDARAARRRRHLLGVREPV